MDLAQLVQDIRDRFEENANDFSLDFLAAAWHHLHQIRDAFQQIVVEGRAADLRIDARAGGGDNQLGFNPQTVLLAMARLRELNEGAMRREMHRVLDQIRGILRTLDIYEPFAPQQPRNIVHNMLMQAVPGIIAPHHPPEVVDFMAMMGQDAALAHLGRLQQPPVAPRPGGNDIQRMVRNNLMHIAGRNQAANREEEVEEVVEEDPWDWSDDEMEDEEQEDEELEDVPEDDAAEPEAPEEEEEVQQPAPVPEAPMDEEQAAEPVAPEEEEEAAIQQPVPVPVALIDAELAAAMMPAVAVVDVAPEVADNVALVPEAPDEEEDAAQALLELAGEHNALEQPAPAQPAGFPILHQPIAGQMPVAEQERHVLELLNIVEDQLGERMVQQMEAINRMMLNLDVMANQAVHRNDEEIQRRVNEVRERRNEQFNAAEGALGPFRRAIQQFEAGDRHALDRAEHARQRAIQAVRDMPMDIGRRRQLMNFDLDVGIRVRERRRELEERQNERLRAANPNPPAPPALPAPPAPRGILIDRRPPRRHRDDGMGRFENEFAQMREYLGLDDHDHQQDVPVKRFPESEKLFRLRGSLDFKRWKAEKVLQWLGLFIKNRDDLEFMEYKHYSGRQLFKILDSNEKWLGEKISFGLYCKMASNMNRLINEHNGFLFEKEY